MLSVGGALLWCALFLPSIISVHSTAGSCPLISADYCKEASIGADSGAPPSCGYLLRCSTDDSKLEIQFGGRGQWYRVIRGVEATLDGFELEVENPRLSSLLAGKNCEFLYSFRRPGPLFAPPPTGEKSLPPDILSQRCSKSDYLSFFPKLLPLYLNKQSICSPAYDVYYTCDGEQTSSKNNTTSSSGTSTGNCQPTPDHQKDVLLWTLSLNNNSDHNTGPDGGNNDTGTDFTLISVGFSRRHRPRAECFESHEEMAAEGHCDTDLAVAGQKPPGLKTRLIIGFSTATGAALCMFGTLLFLCRRYKKAKTPSTSPTTVFRTPCSDPFSEIDPEAPCDYYPTHVFRYEELHEATNGFSPSNELDEGGHGAVYEGKLRDGRAVAVKRLYENSFKRAEQFMNEIAILSCVRHPNLVALYGCTSRHSRELVLVYEFIPNGTVADHLHGDRAAEGALTWPVRLRIAVETAKALAYLHAVEPQIIHRDVKTKNILLDRDFHVKVADFGLSRFFPVAASYVSTVPQGTPGYVDPDYHRCYQLTDKSDVYSFGVVLVELISSKPAVDFTRGSHEINLADMALRRIQSAALDELVDPKLGFQTDWEVRKMIELVAELAMRCLQAEREMRPSMEDVLEVLRGIEDSHHRSGG